MRSTSWSIAACRTDRLSPASRISLRVTSMPNSASIISCGVPKPAISAISAGLAPPTLTRGGTDGGRRPMASAPIRSRTQSESIGVPRSMAMALNTARPSTSAATSSRTVAARSFHSFVTRALIGAMTLARSASLALVRADVARSCSAANSCGVMPAASALSNSRSIA